MIRTPPRRVPGTGPPAPHGSLGDPCTNCGEPLVLCLQCGTTARCLACHPYERPSLADDEYRHLYRTVRAQPGIGLLAGTLLALIPALLLWAGAALTALGPLRAAATVAGTASICALLAKGAAMSKMPIPGETPGLRRRGGARRKKFHGRPPRSAG